jgi:hypothetical protein
MSKYEDMEEDALSELVEESEGNADVKTLVEFALWLFC